MTGQTGTPMERSIYEFPELFRRVHMERPGDIQREVKFLVQVWSRYLKRPVRRLLDIGAGDSPHGQIFARQGLAVVGIDRSPTMIAAGRAQAAKNPRLKFYRRRIERFTLPEPPFDAAIFMSETFPIITRNADLLTHLAAVARALRSGGLYCIDIDRHAGVELITQRRQWRERKVRVGAIRIDVREFYRPIAWDEGLHSIYELECRIHFADRVVTTRDIIPVRYTTPTLMDLAARASGCFEMIACCADNRFDRPLARCRGRWLAVLRRK
ncbi:MAG TPA: class I SAM-dependent methyltransferase [Candidatus Binataceae bacterium]|jgi:SAM-dependent methyltransferase|nr:class I SAM-dependent methyltransferase [Candidatus Binataceae bacterium]